MERIGPKTGNPLEMFALTILLILCLPNVSNTFYHGTGGYQLSAQHEKIICECCLGENGVRSWNSYSINGGSPGIFSYIFILVILCLPNVSNETYHDTGENKLSAEQIGGMVSITLFQIVYQIRRKKRNHLAVFVFPIFY